ncbi:MULTISPECIES: hypothetical protein [unclassified Aeromonas]|uniref:hypothetical protein n=1 Tax=unclassified Aeromonas TaxID=257493 RepID=UPI0035273716
MGNDKAVVGSIFNELFFDNLPRYQDALSRMPNMNSDAYAKARDVISKLGDGEREAIFSFLKLVMTDTASVILGTIDGTHFPDGIVDDFKLFYGEDEIQGCLQGYFIAQAENISAYK